MKQKIRGTPNNGFKQAGMISLFETLEKFQA